MTRIDAITFDLDGTLYSLPRLRRWCIFRQMRSLRAMRTIKRVREGLRGEVFATGAEFRGAERHELARAAEISVQEAESLLVKTESQWLEGLRKIGPFKSVRPALERCKAAGLKIGIVSDYRAERKLDVLGLSDISFDTIVAADEVGALKPYPACFEEALSQMGVVAEHTAHIGDRVDTDGKGASSVGVTPLIVGRDARSLSAAVDRVLGGRS